MTRILLVDDEAELLTIQAEYLRQVGFRVDTATSGRDAVGRLDAVEGDPYAVAVIDWSLPDLPGRRLVRLLEQRAPGCRVLIQTGHLADVVDAEATIGPVVGVLRKPIRLRELAERLRAAVRGF